MELNVYSILDLKTKAYGQPFYAKTRGEAIRSFTSAINAGQPDNMLRKYPGDFELYEIATWDDNLGHMSMLDSRNNLGLASHYVNQEDGKDTNH